MRKKLFPSVFFRNNYKINTGNYSVHVTIFNFMRGPPNQVAIASCQLIYRPTIFLNKPNLPLKGGYLMAGSNQVGVFITALRCEKVSKEFLP